MRLIEAREVQQAIALDQNHPDALSQLMDEFLESPVELMNRSLRNSPSQNYIRDCQPTQNNDSRMFVPDSQEFCEILNPTSEGNHFAVLTPRKRPHSNNPNATEQWNDSSEPMEVCSPSRQSPEINKPAKTAQAALQPSRPASQSQTGRKNQSFIENGGKIPIPFPGFEIPKLFYVLLDKKYEREPKTMQEAISQFLILTARNQGYEEGFAAASANTTNRVAPRTDTVAVASANPANTVAPTTPTPATHPAISPAAGAPVSVVPPEPTEKAPVPGNSKNPKKGEQHPKNPPKPRTEPKKPSKKPIKKEKKAVGDADAESDVVYMSSSDSRHNPNPFHPGYNSPEEEKRHREKYTETQDRYIITLAKDLRRRYPEIQDNSLIKRMLRENDIRRTRDSLSKHYRTKLRPIVRQEEITDRLRRRNKRLREKLHREKAARDPEYNPNEPSSGSDDDDEPMDVLALDKTDSDDSIYTASEDDSGSICSE